VTPGSRSSDRGFRITDRDRELLRFLAAHRFVLAAQVNDFLGRDPAVTYRRLGGLVRCGLVTHRRIFHAQPGIFQITPGGLGLIDSPLPAPKLDLRTYRHDIGAAWLWLKVCAGWLGEPAVVWTEREMHAADKRDRTAPEHQLFGVEVDGTDRVGRPRLHHADLLMTGRDGHGTAVELELSAKARGRLESILLGYAHAPRIHRVVYLTDDRAVGRGIRAAAGSYGLDHLVRTVYLSSTHQEAGWWQGRSISDLQGGAR